MNTIVTSKEEILKTSREMIRQQGWSAISIRSVAAACGVSVGFTITLILNRIWSALRWKASGAKSFTTRITTPCSATFRFA